MKAHPAAQALLGRGLRAKRGRRHSSDFCLRNRYIVSASHDAKEVAGHTEPSEVSCSRKNKKKNENNNNNKKKILRKKKKVFFIICFICLEIENGGEGRAPGSAALCSLCPLQAGGGRQKKGEGP